MQFSSFTVLLSLAASAFAAPTPADSSPLDKRALAFRKYNTFQISDGVGGNALAETNQAFPVDMRNPGAVSKADLAVLVAARQTAENAETAFNSAVAAASGAAAQALDVGKTKNKVLKLRTFEMLVQVQQARGSTDKDAQLADIQKKLAANVSLVWFRSGKCMRVLILPFLQVKLDQANKGKKSQSVSFTADVQPK